MTQVETDGLLARARALAPEIARHRAAIDNGERLPSELVEQLRAAGMFGLWLPAELGGPELHPVDLVRVVAELARADGSVGWCAGVAATFTLLGASLAPEVARAVFGGGQAVAGAFRPKGTATPVAGGLRVSGRWEFGSGVGHAGWIAVQCRLPDGELRFAIVPVAEVEVISAWDVVGLRGTGSHDLRLGDVFVPTERTAAAFASAPRLPGPLYRIPLLRLSATALAAVTLGLARSAVEALVALAGTKTPTGATSSLREQARAQFAAGRAAALVNAARAALFAALHQLYDEAADGEAPSADARTAARLACAYCAEACAQAIDIVYIAAGSNALFEGETIARCFRDVHAATQHIGLSADNYEHAGRALFGHPTGNEFA